MDRCSSRIPSEMLPSPRLKVAIFSKRKGVRYHRNGLVRSCRFCEIARTKSEPFLYQDNHVVVFRPMRPVVPNHVLIVPRIHIRNVNQLAANHRELLARMHRIAEEVMIQDLETECVELQPQEVENVYEDGNENRVRYSFHVPPFNSIDHVHMHAFLDYSRSLNWYGRLKYRTGSWWCRSYKQVMATLDKVAIDGHDNEEFYEEESSLCLSESFREAPDNAGIIYRHLPICNIIHTSELRSYPVVSRCHTQAARASNCCGEELQVAIRLEQLRYLGGYVC